MPSIRLIRITRVTTCQHYECRTATNGPQRARYRVILDDRITSTRCLCAEHAEALAKEYQHGFQPEVDHVK